MKSKDFKNLSLNQLKGKWWPVIGALFVATLLIFVASYIAQLPTIITGTSFFHDASAPIAISLLLLNVLVWLVYLAVTGCITFGIAKYMLHFVRTGVSDMRLICSGFSFGGKTIIRSTLVVILMSLFIFLWWLIPGILIGLGMIFIVPNVTHGIAILLGVLAAIVLFIIVVIVGLRYSQAYYVLADDKDISAYGAIKKSSEIMKGHKGQLFCLGLSFIGWIILGALTLGIGFIFLMPYMEAAYTNFYEYLRGINDHKAA